MSKKSIQQNPENVQGEKKETVQRMFVTNTPEGFLFSKDNYMWMGIGLVFILMGFLLMAGGKSPDPKVFDASEVYSFRRITLAPIMVLIGFAIEGYAIFKKKAKA